MIGFGALMETLRIVRAKPVEPIAVSFAPSTAPGEWSVTVEDVRPSDGARTRNEGRRFREGGR